MKRIVYLIAFSIMVSCNTIGKKTGEVEKLGGVLVVAHKTDNSIHIIERKTGKTLHVLETGLEPHEVEVSDNGMIAVVCNYGNRELPGNTLSVFDLANAKLIKTIDLGEHTRPHGMQWITGTHKMLVTAESTQHLLVVDVEKGVVDRFIFTDQPVSHMVAALPDFTRAYVPSIRTGKVTVIDLQTDTVIAQVYSGKGAEGAAVSPNGKELWVTNRSDNTITIFDTKTLSVIGNLGCGDFPIRIKFSPNGSRVLVSNAQSGDVAIFDGISKSLLANVKLSVPLPDEVDSERFFAKDFQGSSIPIGLVVPDDRTAYVANTNADLISEICLENYEITRHFISGKQPDGVHFSKIMPIKEN